MPKYKGWDSPPSLAWRRPATLQFEVEHTPFVPHVWGITFLTMLAEV